MAPFLRTGGAACSRCCLALALLGVALLLAGCGDDQNQRVAPAPLVDPGKATNLAERYQPILMLERDDGFWPISVLTIDRMRSGNRGPCLHDPSTGCEPITIGQLPWNQGDPDSYVDYPAGNTDRGEQRKEMVDALGSSDLGHRAQLYFYLTGRAQGQPLTLQFWFYYAFNYLPVRGLGTGLFSTDFHEGDFEGLSVLLSARTHRPVYVFMPRHESEGERFVWNEGAVSREGDHPVAFVGHGSHASYESCGRKFRVERWEKGFIKKINVPDDNIDCQPGDLYERGPTIPMVDLARTWWACWPGHFGFAPLYGAPRNAHNADGPRSPLWQQKFDLDNPHPCTGVAPPSRSTGPREAVSDRDTARALRLHGGRLNGLFRSCDEWLQRPPEGSYMVACDQTTLNDFFASGLEHPGPQRLQIRGDPEPTGSTVPAVFRSRRSDAVDQAIIRTRQVAHPEIFVAVREGKDVQSAHFPPQVVRPGEELQLRRASRSSWQLVDRADGDRVVASAEVKIASTATKPVTPTNLDPVRIGEKIQLRFSAGADPETRLVAIGAAQRRALANGGQLLAFSNGAAGGEYELSLDDPERKIRFVRVVASRDGALAASEPAEVAGGG